MAAAATASAAAAAATRRSSLRTMPPPPPSPQTPALAAPPNPPTIYDAYPLTLRAYLTEGPPPLERSLSQQRIPVDDTSAAARRLQELFEPPMPSTPDSSHHGDNGTTYQRVRAERRSSSMCSRFGKFQGEVYETKERSRVMSVLKRRARTSSNHGSSTSAMATRFTADDVLRCGTLLKQGSWRRNWKSRFFILRKDCPSLCYYKSEENLELLGSILVTEDTLVLDRCAPGGHAPYRFLVRSGEHSLLLQAEARDGQQRWIDSVQALADSVRADKFRQSTRHVVDRDPTTASLAQRPQAPTQVQASAPVAIPSQTQTPKTPQRRRRRAEQRSSDNQLSHMASSRSLRSASDLDRLLEANSLSSSDEEDDDDEEEEEEEHDNQRDHEDDDEEEDDDEDDDEEDDDVAVALQDDDDDVWASHRSHGTVIEAHATTTTTEDATTRRRPSRVEQLSSSTPLPTVVAASSSSSAFDLVLEVSIGRASKLLRSIDDRTACLVRVAAFSSTRKALVEIGCTDAVLLAPLAAAASSAATVRVPFAVVLTAELGRDVDQLRVALYKVSGHSQSCVGVGRVTVDAAVRHGQPTVTSLTEKSSSFQTIKVDAASSSSSASHTVAPTLGAMGSVPNLSLDSSALQVVVTAFRSLAPQRVLPTSGVDMANAKYLVAVGADASHTPSRSLSHSHSQHTIGPETSVSVTSPTSASASASEWQLRASDARGLGIDNSSFLTVSSELGTAPAPADVRRLAVDEILRVPRSSFALVLAFLDYLEESALERTRELQRRLDDAEAHNNDSDDHESALLAVELEFYRRKLEEYLRQRQFLMKQERRLLDAQLCDDVARHAREHVQLALNQSGGGKPQSAAKRLRRIATGASASSLAVDDDVVAPFKRSTYKSLELWQLMPTNMQNQFLVAHQPTTASDSDSSSSSNAPSFVWHTMTMGCPAAHTKGFTNGGYLSLAGVPERATPSTTGATAATGASSISGHDVRHSNPASASSEEDSAPSLDYSDLASSPYPRQTQLHHQQQQQQQRRSRSSLSSSTPVFRGSASASSASGIGGAVDDPVAALKTRLELQDRLDIVSSQILSAAVACIQASLDLATLGSPRHRLQLANATKFGFLVHFESLLSTQGKEIGMLEDFAAGAKWLGHHVVVQFRKHRSSGELFVIKPYTAPERRAVAGGTGLDGAYSSSLSHVEPSSSSLSGASLPSLPTLLVTIGVSDAQLATLPPALASGKPFRLRCVLFTQGVNEKQSLAHALKSAAVRLQERINRENLEELRELYGIFRRVHAHDLDCVSRDRISRQHSDGAGANCISRYRVETLDELLATIEHHVLSAASTHKKNVALLMDTADFCRELGGARVTCCKSGKDRTAMSVTLEQARLCGSELHALHGQRLCATMRRHGVRRRNVFLNTKSTKFAFNEMQRRLLPDCYKPPAGTYKSGKT